MECPESAGVGSGHSMINELFSKRLYVLPQLKAPYFVAYRGQMKAILRKLSSHLVCPFTQEMRIQINKCHSFLFTVVFQELIDDGDIGRTAGQ
jgi:hypothetical protein